MSAEFKFTAGQEVALKMIDNFLKSDRPCDIAILTGFAGTGKTTIMKATASQHGTPIFLAPTGKAAVRLTESTGHAASTLHKFLYRPKADEETGEVKFSLRDAIEFPEGYDYVVVDEASMLSRQLWEDLWNVCQLRSYKVLLVGDTFQLPPVEILKKDEESFSALTIIETQHRAHLSEVTRQALDSPILRASMILREAQNPLPALNLLKRVWRKDLDEAMVQVFKEGGVSLVHKNQTRHDFNKAVRARLGYGEEVIAGEPLLVTKNNYRVNRFNGEVLKFNGWGQMAEGAVTVKDRWKKTECRMVFGTGDVEGCSEKLLLSPDEIRGETGGCSESSIATGARAAYCDWLAPPEFVPLVDGRWQGPTHLNTNFGYALSTHKAQGSEWPVVLVYIENSVRLATPPGRRWTYTAITRAREKCLFSIES